MVMTWLQARSWIQGKLSSRRGQNTVEYLMMLLAVVTLVVVVGKLLSGKMPDLMTSIMGKITTAIGGQGMGSTP